MATLYENIVGLCEERGIKPGKAAVDVCISKSIMTRLKKDPSSTIDTQTAQKLAEYFGVSLDRVLYGNVELASKQRRGKNRLLLFRCF